MQDGYDQGVRDTVAHAERARRTYAEMAVQPDDVTTPPTPQIESDEPGSIRTTANSPRIKLELSMNVNKSSVSHNTNIEDMGAQKIIAEELDDALMDSVIDAGGIEIDDMDTYHPDSVTPSQRLVTDTRLPIRTRSRANADMADASLIHYALTQLTLKDGLNEFGKRRRTQ